MAITSYQASKRTAPRVNMQSRRLRAERGMHFWLAIGATITLLEERGVGRGLRVRRGFTSVPNFVINLKVCKADVALDLTYCEYK